MFWLPRKTIYKGPRFQRGNIVVELGLPPQYMPDITGDLGGGWTIDDEVGGVRLGEWDSGSGDFTSILAAQGLLRCDGFAWSPDGTKLSWSNSSDDDIYTFVCSTPWQPNTGTLFSQRGVTNGAGIQFSEGGNWLAAITVVGDTITQYPCTNYAINASGTPKEVSKTDVGLSGGDGAFATTFDLQTILWEGFDPAEAMIKVSTPGPDFDAATKIQTVYHARVNPNAGTSYSQVTLDGTLAIKGVGSVGLKFRRMTDGLDLSTMIDWEDEQAINSLSVIDMRPDRVWFDPKNTAYFWALYSNVGSWVRMCRYKTNTPEQ